MPNQLQHICCTLSLIATFSVICKSQMSTLSKQRIRRFFHLSSEALGRHPSPTTTIQKWRQDVLQVSQSIRSESVTRKLKKTENTSWFDMASKDGEPLGSATQILKALVQLQSEGHEEILNVIDQLRLEGISKYMNLLVEGHHLAVRWDKTPRDEASADRSKVDDVHTLHDPLGVTCFSCRS